MTDLRCSAKDCLDGPPLDDEPAPRLATQGYLCGRCSDALQRRVAELPARRDLLHNVLLHGTAAGARLGNSTTKGNPPLPSRGFDSTHDALADLEQKTVSWVQLVAEERREHGPDRQTIRALASYLVGRHDWIVRQPWVDDMAEEMRDLARVADGLTAHKARFRRLDMPCPVPDCGQAALGQWDTVGAVQCGSCGAQWDSEEFLQQQADLYTMTALRAAAWLEVQPGTFRGYVTSGAITSIGKDKDGLSRYRAEDVARLDTREEKTA